MKTESSGMKSLTYKPNTKDVLNRLRLLYEKCDQSRIFATMEIPDRHLIPSKLVVEFRKHHKEGECNYPDPHERILFWDKVLKERINILDDSIPCVRLGEMDEGLYGGIIGGDVRFMCNPSEDCISSMCPPILDDWAEFNQLEFDTNNEWYKRYVNQLKIFIKGASDKFGIGILITSDGLGFVVQLVGATKAYLSLIDEPEMIQRAIDFAFDINVNIQKTFFHLVPMLDKGTCSNEAEWLPGRIISNNVDAFHMTSVEYFEQWGKEPVERIFSKFDGGILHIHSNGRHLLKSVSAIKGLKAINLGDDKGVPPVFDDDKGPPSTFKVLNKIRADTGNIPLIVKVGFKDFCKAIDNYDLIGGILYKVTHVPDVDSANYLMDKVRKYRV